MVHAELREEEVFPCGYEIVAYSGTYNDMADTGDFPDLAQETEKWGQ